jgi:hypothetical protein
MPVKPTTQRGKRASDAQRREHKDRIVVSVMALCRDLRIRALLGGGAVLTAHGLISPRVAQSAALIVDPASVQHLIASLREVGWRDAPRPRGIHLLPSMTESLVHPDWVAGLTVLSVIPGFFADPEETFDILWERRRQVRIGDAWLPALDRVATAVFASHDGLGGRASRSSSHFEFFMAQFRQVLSEEELADLALLVRRVGGCAEMCAMLEALDITPCAFTLPSAAYAQWRLQVDSASDQVRRAIALLELPPHGRRMLYRSKSGRPASLADVVAMVTGLPTTARAIFGARRRWQAVGAEIERG